MTPLERLDRPQSLSDLAYEQLRAGILAGEFHVGRRMSVVTVAEQLSISRSPVRAAVERLSAEGLLAIDATGIELVGYDRDYLLATLDVRKPLEILASELAAKHATYEQRSQLAGVQREFDEAVAETDPVRSYEADVGFHHQLWEICGNEVLQQELERLHARGIVASFTVAWAPIPDTSVPEHAAILAAILAGDPIAAAEASAVHMDHLIDRVRTGASHPEYTVD